MWVEQLVDPLIHYKCDNKVNQVFLILTIRELSVNRKKTYKPLPWRDHPHYLDPLAVLLLDNLL